MKKPFLSVKLKDPQPYYLEDESIECIVELKSEKALKDPLITIIFKGRSSSYSNFSRIYYVPIFDIEQEIKHPTIDMNAAVGRVVSAEFKVEIPKGTSIPSSRALEGGDGGKVEYMVEAVLSTAGVFKRSVLVSSIVVIPMVSKINVDREELSRPLEKETCWPKNEADANTCTLTAAIPRSGWVRGSSVPVYISWRQPERMNATKKVTLTLVRQELISSNKDTPPDMTKQLKDKIVEITEKELALINGPNRTLNTSLQHLIEIPSNIVPTINENGKVVRLDYKICVTVHVSGMEPIGRDKELSINLPIIIGTEGKMTNVAATPAFNEKYVNYNNHNNNINNNNNNFVGMYGENFATSPGGFRMPEPIVHHPNAYPPPNQFKINPEKITFPSIHRKHEGDHNNDNPIPTGMPVPFIERSNSVVMEDPRNHKASTGHFSPTHIPDCYPPLDSPTLMSDSHISLDSSIYSPMPTPGLNTTSNRDSHYYDPNVDDDEDELTPRRVATSKKNVKSLQEIYYKPEEGSPK